MTPPTPLRRQLDHARGEHRAATYPGDLAADVRADADRSRWRIGFRAVAGASSLLAATIALVVFLHRPTPPATPAPGPEEAAAQFAMPSRPEMPEDLPLTPPYHELTTIPSKPDFPSRFEAL